MVNLASVSYFAQETSVSLHKNSLSSLYFVLFSSEVNAECEMKDCFSADFLENLKLLTQLQAKQGSAPKLGVRSGGCQWHIPSGDAQCISRILQAQLASETDFTGCGKLNAQLPQKQECPALPSLLLSPVTSSTPIPSVS